MKKLIILFYLLLSISTIVNSQCVTTGAISSALFGEFNGTGLTKVKVYWHIVDDGNSPNLMNVKTAINTTEGIYANHGIQLKSDCINTIFDELLTTNQIDGTERELCNFDEYCKNDGLNIFFMNDDVDFVPAASGIAMIGNNRAVVKITGGEDWRTLVHEIGHCFGLFHPFFGRRYTSGAEWNCETQAGSGTGAIVNSNGVFGRITTRLCNGTSQVANIEWEKVDGSNSSSAGDFVTDTPAAMSVHPSGSETGTPCDDYYDDCSDLDICDNILDDKQRKDQNCHKYTPDWNNYMGYRGGCQDHFTPGQVSRMIGLLQDRLDFMLYSGDIKHITQSTTFDSPQSFNKLRIAENVTVTFKNTEALFAEGGYLQMMEGSNLILDNSTLTTCGLSWIGVQCFDANSIEMINGSAISKADIGIRLKYVTPLAQSFFTGGGAAVHTRLEMDNSTIEVCDIGIQFGYGQSTSVIRNNSKIDWNTIGIRLSHHSGLVIEDTDFYGNHEGIYAVDSYLQVKANTNILGHYPVYYDKDRAISIDGTFPLGSGIQIGDNNGAYNRIGKMDQAGIVSNGSNHPAGVVINNCEFDINLEAGLGLIGENNFNIQNNNFNNSERASFLWATGSSINNINCNIFEDIDMTSNTIVGLNDNTNILENNFIGAHDLDIGLYYAKIPRQGQPDNPAANCFSDPSQSSHIISYSSPFEYHYYNDGNIPDACQEPIDPIGFVPVSSDNQGPGNCDGDIGVFNVISPGGGGSTTGIDPQNDDPDYVCKSCV